MDKKQRELAKVIENYFGAYAGYLDIDCFTLAIRIMEDGWTKPIRCKDCKYYNTSKTNKYGHHACKFHLTGPQEEDVLWVEEDDFCSAGERKDNGAN